jgi:hypothetical protein
MKLKQLIAQADEFLDSDKRKRKEKKKYLKHVLKKLRKYEDEICTKLKTETDPETIEKLTRKMCLAHTQRKKGMILLKSLQSEKNS